MNKVAVVTGAGSGIGRATALKLAANGARVVAVDINEPNLDSLMSEIGAKAISVVADVSDEADTQRIVESGIEAFGKIDDYHLNAGVFGTFTKLPDISLDEFDHVLNINVRGQFLGLRAAFRQYRRQQSKGSIVLTGSIASVTGSSDLLPYVVSKHATTGLIRASAMYGGPLGVRVNGVAPGLVPTQLFDSGGKDQSGGASDMDKRGLTTPMRRTGTASEIADLVSYLLSEESSYITGQLISVDGGASIVNTVRPSGGAAQWDAEAFDREFYGENYGF